MGKYIYLVITKSSQSVPNQLFLKHPPNRSFRPIGLLPHSSLHRSSGTQFSSCAAVKIPDGAALIRNFSGNSSLHTTFHSMEINSEKDSNACFDSKSPLANILF